MSNIVGSSQSNAASINVLAAVAGKGKKQGIKKKVNGHYIIGSDDARKILLPSSALWKENVLNQPNAGLKRRAPEQTRKILIFGCGVMEDDRPRIPRMLTVNRTNKSENHERSTKT
jgi:hypothetical protein